MVKYVPEEQFDATVKEGFWIADLLTDHCGPCKILDVVIGEIVFDHPEINVAKCDTWSLSKGSRAFLPCKNRLWAARA